MKSIVYPLDSKDLKCFNFFLSFFFFFWDENISSI